MERTNGMSGDLAGRHWRADGEWFRSFSEADVRIYFESKHDSAWQLDSISVHSKHGKLNIQRNLLQVETQGVCLLCGMERIACRLVPLCNTQMSVHVAGNTCARTTSGWSPSRTPLEIIVVACMSAKQAVFNLGVRGRRVSL
jgi:hypothetical protein